MTTSPVLSITEELLAKLEQKAKAAVPGCCGEMIPSGVEYGGQREMMCCEAWQQCDVAIDALDILALVEHIRSLTERLEKAEKDAERYRWINAPHNFHAACENSLWKLHGSGEFGLAIDAAIAQEGQSHE